MSYTGPDGKEHSIFYRSNDWDDVVPKEEKRPPTLTLEQKLIKEAVFTYAHYQKYQEENDIEALNRCVVKIRVLLRTILIIRNEMVDFGTTADYNGKMTKLCEEIHISFPDFVENTSH